VHRPDPGVRLRDIAASLGITERRAHGIVTDLTEAGYLIKAKEGRRNRYEIQAYLPIPEPTARERAIGEVLELLGGRPEPTNGVRDSVSRPRRGSADCGSFRPHFAESLLTDQVGGVEADAIDPALESGGDVGGDLLGEPTAASAPSMTSSISPGISSQRPDFEKSVELGLERFPTLGLEHRR